MTHENAVDDLFTKSGSNPGVTGRNRDRLEGSNRAGLAARLEGQARNKPNARPG